MLRTLLLLALMLRLVPAPGMAASHCAPEPVVVTSVEHEHHAPSPEHDHSSSEECTHCPPTDCAKHSSCEAPSVVSCIETPHRQMLAAPLRAALPGVPAAWATTHTAPPTRPPASSLA
ncbi:MAG: hypothetical protein SFU84_12380 [Gemmatimonadales bacterium]|nr:hypothetical protein [Gemmatimonadales bacterium]